MDDFTGTLDKKNNEVIVINSLKKNYIKKNILTFSYKNNAIKYCDRIIKLYLCLKRKNIH